VNKTILGQTEISISQLPSHKNVIDLFETSKDFATAIESQNIPYVVWHDNKRDNFFMLVPTTGGVCKVEFEHVDNEEVSGYQYYLGFADGLTHISLDHYKGTECFFGKEVDCYVRRVVDNEKAA
jgi:predicted transcriptional regulator